MSKVLAFIHILICNFSDSMIEMSTTLSPTTSQKEPERDVVFSGANTTISVFTLFLNGLVFIIFLRQRSLLKQVPNRILLSQCIGDFLTGAILVMQVSLYEPISNCTALLVVLDVVITLLVNSAVLHLLAIAIDRYIGTFYALRYDDIVTKRGAARFILYSWLLSAIFSSIQFFWLYQVMDGEESKEEHTRVSYVDACFSTISIIVFMITPMIVLAVLFVRMFVEIRRILHQTPRMSFTSQTYYCQQFRVYNLFMAMFLTFACLTVPYYVVRLLIDLGQLGTAMQIKVKPQIFEITYLMKNMSPLSNPLVYVICSKQFRSAGWIEFSKLTRLSRRKHLYKVKWSHSQQTIQTSIRTNRTLNLRDSFQKASLLSKNSNNNYGLENGKTVPVPI